MSGSAPRCSASGDKATSHLPEGFRRGQKEGPLPDRERAFESGSDDQKLNFSSPPNIRGMPGLTVFSAPPAELALPPL